MRLPDRPSLFRKATLAPLALAYGAAAATHRALWLRPRRPNRAELPPLVVIGSLRAGGAGKTALTLALARSLREAGLKIGILAYRIHKGGHPLGFQSENACILEVAPDSNWRESSDEAVLLARESGARVFATRDRARAWEILGRMGGFDILLSDDGLMDSRLRGAHRLALVRPGENPGWADLLPAGPYRLPASFLATTDRVLREGEDFVRAPVLPPEWEPERHYWVLCGLGDPEAFLRALRGRGVRIAGCSAGADHGVPDLGRAREAALRAGTDRFLCSAKDWVKLENHPERPAHLLRIGEDVALPTELPRTLQESVLRPAATS